MKKIWFSSLILCICILGCLSVDTLFANGTQYNIQNTAISINVEDTAPQSIDDLYYYKNSLFIIDGTNNNIFKLDLSNNEQSIVYNNEDTIPCDIAISADDKLIVSTSNLFIYIIDLNNYESEPTQIDRYSTGDMQSGLAPAPRKVATSATDDVYFIWDNIIAKLNLQTNLLEHFVTLNYENQDLNFDDGAFFVTEDNSTIYFTIDNIVYSVDTGTKAISTLNNSALTDLTNITYFAMDNLGNTFIFDENNLIKATEQETESVTLTNTTNLEINLETGQIYTANDNQLYLTEITDDLGTPFILGYRNEPVPVNLDQIQISNQPIKIIEANTTTALYTYKSLQFVTTNYEIGKKLIVLDENDENFYYVYDSNYMNGEFGYALGYVLKEDFTATENSLPDEFTSSQQAKVVVNESKLFVLPTSLNIDADTKALFATKLTYDSFVEIVSAPMPPTDFNGVNFYAVKITLNDNEVIGYIDSRTVINVEDETLENVPVPNASTRAETIVYSDSNCENEVETIPQGTNVRIISSNDGVSFIQYFIEDNGQTIIKEGYVRTSFLDDGTLTLTQILGIVLMCVSLIVAIIVAIVISKNKKKKEL